MLRDCLLLSTWQILVTLRLVSSLSQDSTFCRQVSGMRARFDTDRSNAAIFESTKNCSLYLDRLTVNTTTIICVEGLNCATDPICFLGGFKEWLTLWG